MAKSKGESQVSENTAKSVLRNVRTSPRKANLVTGLIRGLPVEQALGLLSTSKRRIAKDVRKVLQSAIANAENNHNLDIDALVVKEAFVGKAMVMKRWQPKGRGRAGKIFKPFSHITVVVSEEEVAV